MWLIVRTEPVGVKYLEGYPQAKELLQQARWLNFIEKFDGFHKEITKSFAKSFDGVEEEKMTWLLKINLTLHYRRKMKN